MTIQLIDNASGLHLNPVLWHEYETVRDARNVVHVLASGLPAVTRKPAAPRRVRVQLLFNSELDAYLCELMHRDAAGTITITDPARPSTGMSYVVDPDGELRLTQETDHPGVWFVEVDTIDVSPRKTLTTALGWEVIGRNLVTSPRPQSDSWGAALGTITIELGTSPFGFSTAYVFNPTAGNNYFEANTASDGFATVNPGVQYEIGAWFFVLPGGIGSYQTYITWWNTSGFVGESSVASVDYTAPPGWNEVKGLVTSPAGATRAVVRMRFIDADAGALCAASAAWCTEIPGGYLDGSLKNPAAEPRTRRRWLGAVGKSQSVEERAVTIMGGAG